MLINSFLSHVYTYIYYSYNRLFLQLLIQKLEPKNHALGVCLNKIMVIKSYITPFLEQN